MDDRPIQKGGCHTCKSHVHKRGSSYWMHDPVQIFRELNLRNGDIFLDIGCGTGDYSIAAAHEVGAGGHVFATDIQRDRIEGLCTRAESLGLKNITAIISDIRDPLPFEDRSIDLCFICTVLHAVDLAAIEEMLFSEIYRILKPGGRLVIIECKKEKAPFGPPLSVKLSPEEIDASVLKYGFTRVGLTDLGHNYMATFGLRMVK